MNIQGEGKGMVVLYLVWRDGRGGRVDAVVEEGLNGRVRTRMKGLVSGRRKLQV